LLQKVFTLQVAKQAPLRVRNTGPWCDVPYPQSEALRSPWTHHC